MVQPFLSNIDVEGEADLVFFDGDFSHAVLKRPVLIAGEGVVERPWERMAWNGLMLCASGWVWSRATAASI